MRLVWQWIQLERELPPSWSDARVVVKVREQDADRAASLLGGANPLRRGDTLRLFVSRKGGFGPEALRRTLLDDHGILVHPLSAHTWRLGLLGADAIPANVRRMVLALQSVLAQ